MKITVLSDSRAMKGFVSEHGLSFLILCDQKKILFDTGSSDLFLRNARKMGIHLEAVDSIVLSHGHWDHGDGLPYLSGLPLLCHPDCFVGRTRKSGGGRLGLALSGAEIKKRFKLTLSRDPVRLSEHLFFLGEIPRENDFEAKATQFNLEGGEEDFIMDDTGLACITEKGVVVISGCAHSGICNMTEHARKVTGVDRVEGVIGGFHLKAVNDQTKKTIAYLKQIGVRRVCPSHCTANPALGLFHDEFGLNLVATGSTIIF